VHVVGDVGVDAVEGGHSVAELSGDFAFGVAAALRAFSVEHEGDSNVAEQVWEEGALGVGFRRVADPRAVEGWIPGIVAVVAPGEEFVVAVWECEGAEVGAARKPVDRLQLFGDRLEEVEDAFAGLRFAFDQVSAEALDGRGDVDEREGAVFVAPPAVACGEDVAGAHTSDDQLRNQAAAGDCERVATHA
jgi:hypothetical protein